MEVITYIHPVQLLYISEILIFLACQVVGVQQLM